MPLRKTTGNTKSHGQTVHRNSNHVITDFCPVGTIKLANIKSNIESTVTLKHVKGNVNLYKLKDGNVTVGFECGMHTLWQHTMSYQDAKKIYNYYLRNGWK